MGLLSKIFDTDKLEYILREEEEFSVDAPKQWNVETLTVGDTITPDMFKDQYRFYDFDLYIKEIGYDDEYEYDDDMEGDFYVTTEFDNSAKKYLHNQHTWWFHEINDYLKPEYKVVTPNLSESEDEFNVDAPEDWNVTELKVGDFITPDMWKNKQYDLNIQSKTAKITDIGVDDKGPYVVLAHENWSLDYDTDIINDLLKPQFKIEQNLTESDDEFNVTAPENWNVEMLTVGDTIEPNMWIPLKDLRKQLSSETREYMKYFQSEPRVIKKTFYDNDDQRLYFYIEDSDAEWTNNLLKPQYKVTEGLKESDDDFNVTAPEEWNYEDFTGTTNKEFKQWVKKILKKHNIEDDFIETYLVDVFYGEWDFNVSNINELALLNNFNDWIEDQNEDYGLNESEDEFTVDAPESWNVTELGVGDYITPEMIDTPKDRRRWTSFHKAFGDPKRAPGWKVVKFINEELDNVFYVKLEHNGVKDIFSISAINKRIKPQFKIVPPTNETKLSSLLEQDDEFSVDAPTKWNVTELTVGDEIEPHMWDLNNIDLYDFIDDPNENWIIDKIDDRDIQIVTETGGETWCRVDDINGILKPEYKIVEFLSESEDEFSVKAPKQWNVETLTVGDTITPDMWNKQKFINDGWFGEEGWFGLEAYNKTIQDSYLIQSMFFDEGDEDFEADWQISLNSTTTGKSFNIVEDSTPLKILNSLLKDNYKIYPPNMNESEDEFTVNAPQSWDVIELTIGDKITPDMIKDWVHEQYGKIGFKILDLKDSDDGALVRLQVLNSTRLPIYWNLEHINNNYLKSQYRISPSSFNINESEDDFNVTAPTKWNIEYLSVGDIITPDMWQGEVAFFDTKQEKLFKKLITKPVKIDYVFEGDNIYFTVEGIIVVFTNDVLLPQYQVVKDKYVFESEDDFSVNAPQGWDVTELGVGDYITPEMINVPKNKRQWDNFHHIFADLKRAPGWKINKFFFISERGVYVRLEYRGNWHDFRVDFINKYLKPQFKISPSSFNITESEDEFNVDAPVEWNQEYLTAGDTITPDMWDQSKLGRRKDYFEKPIKIDWIGYNEFDDEEVELLVGLNLGDLEVDYDIDFINNLLKPEYKIVSPGLNESEDEFSVDAPSEWNAPDLKIGSIITPEMWGDEVKELSSINQFKIALTTPLTIKTIYPQNIGGSPGLLMGFTNGTYIHSSFLKPQYQIISNLSENDDEFTVDAPESWNVTELGIGSILDPSNLKMQDHSKKYEIVDFGVTLFPWENKKVKVKVFELVEEPIPGTRRTTRQWKHTRNSSIDLDTLKSRLKDNYKIISTLSESDDDEFTVKAPKGWDVTYLRVGDTITPDMWNKREIKQVTSDVSFDEPLKIKWIGTDGFDGVIEFEGYDSDYLNVEFIHDILKPKYRISLSNINESDDEFNVDAPEDWNVQYLGVGDTIQGKMWNWENIITWCNRVAGDNNVELNELIRRWEDVYDEGATIDRIVKYGDYHHVEFDSDSGFLRFGPNVSTVNNWLSDGYEIEKSLTEEAEDFNVIASPKWDIIELGVGDYINSNMLNPKGNDYTWFSRRKLFIEDIYFDECWTVNLLHVESNYHTQFCIDYMNEDVLNDKYKIMNSLNELSKLLEVDDEFTVDAPQKWDVIELGVGDKITRDMIKNPVFLDQMDEDFRMDFPGVITNMYRAGVPGDEYWGVRIKFQDVGWRKYLPKSKDIKLGLGFTLDGFNQNTLKPQYQIQKPVFELSSLLENEEDFNVNAPDEWNVELLTVGDTITPDMWEYDGIFFDVSKPLTIEDIGEDEGGWWIQLGRSEAPFDLDEINEYLKSKYRVVPYILEESDDEFSVNAPEEWNEEYWEPTESEDDENYIDSFDKFARSVLKKQGIEDEIIESYLDEIYHFGDISTYEGISSSELIKDFSLWTEAENDDDEWYDAINEEEDEFNVSAPEEWNITQLGVNDVITPDMWSKKGVKISLIINKIEKRGIIDGNEWWEIHMRPYGSKLQNNEKSSIIVDLNDVQNHLKPEYKITKNKVIFEEEDEFNVSAPEEWWEYDGDVEIMFQDTYWYEDENGKEAIVERDGGGILNINDLEQYSYSGWKPFTGNPTNENLKNWWYSIEWDTDLIEIFNFDDSIFEVEEDFEWSSAENIDMDRTGFRIRAVSTLNESDDEFTVKPSKKWDIVYLNKGDFLDNTNSTFNDPNLKYEIGNITSDGEIEVKKYINRGSGFEPQFDRFMKTRKGIVKAKLKPGFDIETSSK
jgi:hypothetical protein